MQLLAQKQRVKALTDLQSARKTYEECENRLKESEKPKPVEVKCLAGFSKAREHRKPLKIVQVITLLF